MTGGALWFPDLSVPDTTYLLPAAGAGLMLATVELNASDMGSADQSGMMKSFMRIMSVAFLGMGGYLPSVRSSAALHGRPCSLPATLFSTWTDNPLIPHPVAAVCRGCLFTLSQRMALPSARLQVTDLAPRLPAFLQRSLVSLHRTA